MLPGHFPQIQVVDILRLERAARRAAAAVFIRLRLFMTGGAGTTTRGTTVPVRSVAFRKIMP